MLPFGMVAGGAGASYQISNSVRLRASASAYFNRTFGAGGDRDKWWILIPFKRSTLGAAQYLFGADTASADAVYFNSSDKLCVDIAGTNRLISTRVFRDPSAWGAFLVVFDASNGTNDLKLRVYHIDNGFAEITAWGTNTRSGITAGTSKTTLNTAAAVIGKNPTAANSYFDGYLSHFHIGTWSGSQPTPASFGSNDANGVWVFSGASSAYGTQGSWLDFKDANLTAGSNVGLGKDVSGNGNYWNTNNISVTAGVTYDSMVDTPTNVYATLNPITRPNNYNVLSNGNLYAIRSPTAGTGWNLRSATLPANGKVYVETKIEFTPAANYGIGLVFIQASQTDNVQDPSAGAMSDSSTYGIQVAGTSTYKNVAGATTSIGVTPALNDTLQVAFDIPNGNMWIGVNNTWSGGGNPATGTSPTISGISASTIYFVAQGLYSAAGATGAGGSVCFGQRPWAYSAPAGFGGICTANLPAAAIPQPSKHHDVKTHAGSASTQSITGVGFQPDLVWVKDRGNAQDHKLTDSVRGTTKALISDTTGAETTDANGVTAFNSNGFSLGTGTRSYSDSNTDAYVDWLWKAGGNSNTFNKDGVGCASMAAAGLTDGSIAATGISVNTVAGFSIVTYTGTGANATVGHGLGVVPKFIIIKIKSQAGDDWICYHASLGNTGGIRLNLTNAAITGSATLWNSTTPTTSVFSLGTGANANTNGQSAVAYCFAEIPGYSKFGSYVGNGNADGPFVWCGFRPKYVLIKGSSGAARSWMLQDTTRDTYNLSANYLLANDVAVENTTGAIDFTATGFKLRSTGSFTNAAETYIFAAFAEFPFGGSNVAPSPAR